MDDGKSTLIGRLLYDAGLVPADQLDVLARESRGRSCGPEGLDFSLLLDGLAAEREQGITIDVAYRYFATKRRSFIVADAPGHEQYLRNMATAASNASAAIVLVDARKGLLDQTYRHATLLGLMNTRHVALVVNKMDLAGCDARSFEQAAESFQSFVREMGFASVVALPVSATNGANVVRRDHALGWYDGPTLLDWLEDVPDAEDVIDRPFRMAVQWVNRASPDFRGYAGRIASGRIRPGDQVASSAFPKPVAVSRIVTMDGDLAEAGAGEAVTLVLAGDVDLGRGSVLSDTVSRPHLSHRFVARIVWLGDGELVPHRPYLIQLGTDLVRAEITEVEYRIGFPGQRDAREVALDRNEVGLCHVAASRPVAFEIFRENRSLGSLTLIDPQTYATVGAGVIERPLEPASDVYRQGYAVTRQMRAEQKGQRPAIVWFTGLSGAGKSTIANIVDRYLHQHGHHSVVLDGDNVRHGLNRDLGFAAFDRAENVRRVAEVARLMADAGLIVLVSLISPFRVDRAAARVIAGEVDFVEIFVDTPMAVCEARDMKGLYRSARGGRLPNFTGIGSPYEPPDTPELHLRADLQDAEACAAQVIEFLREK